MPRSRARRTYADVELVGREQTDLDEVEGMHPRVTDRYTTGARDRVAERGCPQVLDQRDRGRAAGFDGVGDVPDLVLVDEVPVGACLGSGDGPGRHAFFTGEPEPEQGAEGCAEIFGLVDREVAPLEGCELAVQALLHGESVDEPDDVAVPKTRQAPRGSRR